MEDWTEDTTNKVIALFKQVSNTTVRCWQHNSLPLYVLDAAEPQGQHVSVSKDKGAADPTEEDIQVVQDTFCSKDKHYDVAKIANQIKVVHIFEITAH